MTVRPASQQDASAIAAIWNAEIRDGVSTFNSVERGAEEIASQIADAPKNWLVAEVDGQVVGFATLSQFRGGVGYRHSLEHTIYLAPKARGCDLGRALMQRIEQSAREQGTHVLIAAIGGENSDGIAFHAAIGFSETGRMPELGRKFGRWMDLVLMQKKL